jgi:hypothetical protein
MMEWAWMHAEFGLRNLWENEEEMEKSLDCKTMPKLLF